MKLNYPELQLISEALGALGSQTDVQALHLRVTSEIRKHEQVMALAYASDLINAELDMDGESKHLPAGEAVPMFHAIISSLFEEKRKELNGNAT